MGAEPDRLATRAVILAAGLGSRLGPFTERLPKPLLTVGGTPILESTVRTLAAAGVERTMIVVGHLGGEIAAAIGPRQAGMEIEYAESDRFESTNDIYSLWRGRGGLQGDTLVIEGDVLFDPAVLKAMRAPGSENVAAVARFEPSMDGTVVAVDPQGLVEEIFYADDQGPGFEYEGKYKTINVWLFRGEYLERELLPELERMVKADEGMDRCFEVILASAIRERSSRFRAADCSEIPWYEVDTHEDRRAAEYMFSTPPERLQTIAGQHGGYWRHDLVDHRLLTNAHFPSAELMAEIAAELDHLVREYPVGQAALAEIAGTAFGHRPDRIVVGNGSSELMKHLVGAARRAVVVPVPSFNEYESLAADRVVRVPLAEGSFRLDVEAVLDGVREHRADLAVVISPNNPTAVAEPAAVLGGLARQLHELDCRLLLDESFVDFCADPAEHSLEWSLDAHPNLVVMKSVSKVFGVGGLRLGYLATADTGLAAEIAAKLPIWHVNGPAEAFLRTLPGHLRAFRESCALTRRETDELSAGLESLAELSVLPSDANYVLVQLPLRHSAEALVERLFAGHGILVKDCAGKSMPEGDRYLRIASRGEARNERFLEVFASLLGGPDTRAWAGVAEVGG
ncbi:MAG TPA: aminotransferase class I/II-fold pyridoxal phosphate-dependent enzyme [Solirubrobacterales bacterium]|nr:aminotransferase class I/II-fold pyridoxal phosphate-dependent enzyme [Solirubrobacterales bacterium]